MTPAEREACLVMLNMFVIDGLPAGEVATDGQIEIFFNLIFRPHLRLQILCSTQYGKSLFVALACIIITCVQHEVVAVLAPTTEKAKIIMRYYIQHLGDHPSFQTELEKNTKLDRLRMEESKDRIMLKHGGGIFIISVQTGNVGKGVESAMGAGAKIVIQDESGLIPDTIESTVFRMIAGKGEDAFYCKIGNPFYRNHFHTSWNDPAYHKIFIDYHRGLDEGRYNAAFIEEARRKPFFDILFACIFPGESMMDDTGYLQLIPRGKIIVRTNDAYEIPFLGRKILGIDPSGEGKDKCTFVLRDRFKAALIHSMQSTNDREIAEMALTFIDRYQLDPNDVVVGAFGTGSDVGKEVALATKDMKRPYELYTVMEGNSPEKEEDYNGRFFRRFPDELTNPEGRPKEFVDLYLNMRALMYFRARKWLIAGGQLVDDDVENSAFANELAMIRYKRALQGNRIQLMSKKEMLKLGIPSPNIADAFSLTFLRTMEPNVREDEEERKRAEREEESVNGDDRFNTL